MPAASLSCPDFLLFLQRLVGPGGEGRAGQRADDEDPEAGHGRGVAGEERHQRGAEGARVGQGTVLCPTIMDSVVPGQVGRGTVPCPLDVIFLSNVISLGKNVAKPSLCETITAQLCFRFCFRYCIGVMPNCFLNTFWK